MVQELIYSFSKPIASEDVRRLMTQTSWAAKRSLEGIQRMLDNSLCLGVWQDEELIGFARVVTDDIYRAFIEDVVVDGEFRGQGIGAEIMRVLLKRLEHLEDISLCCEDHLIPFYGNFGFERMTITHMHIWRG